MRTEFESIQRRNIKSVVKQLAEFCFESPHHPKYGSCYLALVSSLTANDGLVPVIEPFPEVYTKPEWIPVKSYKEVPNGTWLVKVNRPIAGLISNIQVMRKDDNFAVIGQYFAYDEEDVIEYRSL